QHGIVGKAAARRKQGELLGLNTAMLIDRADDVARNCPQHMASPISRSIAHRPGRRGSSILVLAPRFDIDFVTSHGCRRNYCRAAAATYSAAMARGCGLAARRGSDVSTTQMVSVAGSAQQSVPVEPV